METETKIEMKKGNVAKTLKTDIDTVNCQIMLQENEFKITTETENSKQNEKDYAVSKAKSMTSNAIETCGKECSEHHATTTTTTAKANTTCETIEMPSAIKSTETTTTTTTTATARTASEPHNFKAPAALLFASASKTTSTTSSTAIGASLLKKTPSDYIFGKCIGEGSFSSVYLALGRQDRRKYAIKVCDKRHILRERKQVYVRRERDLLQVMSNTPGIVNLICTFQDNRSLYFVLTYAPNGELLSHIKRVGCLSVACARYYAAELLLACEQMHLRNVVHRDLKPENILLDANMHTLIADFGSAKLLTTEDIAAAELVYSTNENPATPTPSSSSSSTSLIRSDESDDVFDEGSDEEAAIKRKQRYRHKRKGSFVGTAQYVSPEVLQNMPITPAADLWALGCIIYQMISGMPPFRGYNDFAIFKEILALNFEFPENFDKAAKELVRELLKIKPMERLGAKDELYNGGYVSIRTHALFVDINFENIREQTPPKICPFLPSFCMDESLAVENQIENLKIHNVAGEFFEALNAYVLNAEDKQRLLEQQKSDKWHNFTENEVILRKGLVNKHKGLFCNKRMLLLTTGPHLIYVDPVEMIRMGEITWESDLHAEVGNQRIFYVHTAKRTHFFEVLEGSAIEWVAAIDKVHALNFETVTERNAERTNDSQLTYSIETELNAA